MSLLRQTAFTSYIHSPEEQILGSSFSQLQKEVLRNLLTESAEARLALEFDPSEPLKFVQQEAYHKGKIEVLTYLLDNSEAVAALQQ